MSKYLKKFPNHADYQAFIGGGGETQFIRPNVSHCVQENHVHYNPIRYYVTCTYSVEDATQPTQLYFYVNNEYNTLLGKDMLDIAEIDGTEVSIKDLDAAEGMYQLTAGEHTVKFALKDKTEIHEGLFDRCESLTSVVIPNTVTSIGDYAFGDCYSLTSVAIPNSVTSIGRRAFYECTSLTSIAIPNSVTSIGDGAFERTNIQNLYIDTTVVDTWFSEHTSIESITLGNNVKTIVDGAFCCCFDVNDEDKSIIENFNDKAFCETYCITATFQQSTQKAILGTYALGYYIDGVKIPDDEIIIE